MSKNKIDIGSKMSFSNKNRDYSLKEQKTEIKETEKIVKIDLNLLEESPKDWNFYPPLNEEDFEKLIHSIIENGLLHPIVVRRVDNKNIILSGHNRVRAFKEILKDIEKKENGEESRYFSHSDANKSDYTQIMSLLKENISDIEAKEIIIDANYVQRNLNPRLITKSVIEKYKIIQDKRKNGNYKSEKTRDIVAKEFNLSGRHIDRYKKLDSLHTDILEMFYEGRISLELASKIALLKENVQNKIAKNYKNLLPKYPSKIASNLKAGLSIKEIDKIFKEELIPQDKIIVSITENGKIKNIEITNDKLKEKLLKLLKTNE